jgi:tetratricopeptide (TPR) repeat protein
LFALRVNLAEALVNRSILLYDSSQDIGNAAALIQDALFIYPNDDRAHRAGVELGILELQSLAASPDASSDTMRAQLQSTLEGTIQQGLAAVSIDSGDYQNWLEVASLYQNLAGADVQGAYDNAHTAYESALANNPKDPLLYFDLAQLDVLEKKPDAALADIQSALKLKPDFAAVYYLASQVYTSKNDLVSAATAAAQAVKYAPDDKLGWYNAGVIAYAQGDWQSAVTDEQEALSLDSQYANALYVLGLSYYQLQRPADSMATFEALAKLDPGEAAIGQILSNLEAGQAPLQQMASSTPAIPPTTTPPIK